MLVLHSRRTFFPYLWPEAELIGPRQAVNVISMQSVPDCPSEAKGKRAIAYGTTGSFSIWLTIAEDFRVVMMSYERNLPQDKGLGLSKASSPDPCKYKAPQLAVAWPAGLALEQLPSSAALVLSDASLSGLCALGGCDGFGNCRTYVIAIQAPCIQTQIVYHQHGMSTDIFTCGLELIITVVRARSECVVWDQGVQPART